MSFPIAILLVVTGGILLGLFSLPVTNTPKWKFEHIWCVGSLFSLLIIPWPLVFLTVPDVGALYASVPRGVLLAVILSGAAWGIGGIFWGRGIEALGVALGVSLMMTLITVSGSAGPLAIFEPAKFTTSGGLALLGALAVMTVGVIVMAVAGKVRAQEQSVLSAAAEATAVKIPFLAGLTLAVISGIFSAGTNFGFVFGAPIATKAAESGVPAHATGFAIWSLVFTLNYAINALYGLWMMVKNGTLSRLLPDSQPSYWLGALFMGIAWPGGIIIYGIGAGAMGRYGPYVAFPMLLLVSILAGNAAGALTGEWQGTTSKPRRIMIAGVAILILAFVLLGVSNHLLASS
jgi:L-rhamnose-H+ transport protein